MGDLYGDDWVVNLGFKSVSTTYLIVFTNQIVNIYFSFATSWNNFPTFKESQASNSSLMLSGIQQNVESISGPNWCSSVGHSSSKVNLIWLI